MNDFRSVVAGKRRFLLLIVILFIPFAHSCKSDPEETDVPTKPEIRNILLITVDTLRADALSAYGNPVPTPFLDTLAEKSVVFENAFTCVPITLPAHTSLLTGLYPPSHGVRNNGTFRAGSDLMLLPEIAGQNGLRTAAVIGAFPLDSRFGLNQGFDFYDDHLRRSKPSPGIFVFPERDAQDVRMIAETWLTSNYEHPFFLWVHFFDPHHPYLKHGFGEISPYQQEVLHVDREIARLFDFLKLRGLDQNTMVIFTSDHGEAFGEHGEISHSLFLYNTTLRIPLIISLPGEKSGRRGDLVRIIDIFPTVLDVFDWQSAAAADGVSLLPLLEDPNRRLELQNYSETMAPAIEFGWSPLFAIQNAVAKYIDAPKPEYYSLSQDPHENRNQIKSVDPSPFLMAIESIRSRLPQGAEPHSPTPEEREKLRSLGYLGGRSSDLSSHRVDPKDRIHIARRIAELTMNAADLHEKAEAYAEMAKQESGNPLLLLRYGEILLELKEYGSAEAVFRQALNLPYPFAGVYNGLAAACYHQNKLREAKHILEQAVNRDLGDGETYYNLAEFYLDENRPRDAAPLYEKSMEYGFLPAFFRKADWEQSRGNMEVALSILKRAETRQPSEGEVNYRLGLFYLQLQLRDDARHHLEIAWRKGYHDPHIRELLQQD